MKRSGFLLFGIFSLLAFTIAGCGQQSTESAAQGVQAALGTYNYGGAKPGLAFLIVGDVPMTGPNGIEVKITGPSSWNDGNPIIVHLYHAVAGNDWWWWARTIDIIDGDYTLESDLPGGIHLKTTAHLTANDFLARPAPKLQATRTSVTISWDRVPNAMAYEVDLQHKTDNGIERVAWWRTKETAITFNNLILNSGETYFARVFAFNAPITHESFTPPSIFKISLGKTADFTVTAVGSLKILPASPNKAPSKLDLQGSR